MRILIFFLSFLAFAENVETGKTYSVKLLKYFAPKGEDQNSVAHFVLFKDAKKKHVIEVFCLIPHGEDPKKAKRVVVGERSADPSTSAQYFCDLEK